MSRRARVLFGALLASATLLAACGGDDDDASNSGVAPPPSGPTTTPVEPNRIDPMTGAGTAPVRVQATNMQTALLSAVRAARHEGYDRVVFEFRNAVPGYDVRYVQPPVHQDGSGKVVPVQGGFVVQIRMENALDADLSKESAPSTFKGLTRFSPSTPEVVELVRTGGFEGVLTWVAGLRDRVAFRVTALPSPPRLVVDFTNH